MKGAAAQQPGQLLGVDPVGLGLGPVNRLEVQSVAQHEGDRLGGAQISEPVPGEHALAGDDEAVAEGLDRLEEGGRRGGDGVAEDGRAVAIEDADGKGPGVEIDAAVESVLLVVESHHGLRGIG